MRKGFSFNGYFILHSIIKLVWGCHLSLMNYGNHCIPTSSIVCRVTNSAWSGGTSTTAVDPIYGTVLNKHGSGYMYIYSAIYGPDLNKHGQGYMYICIVQYMDQI